MYQQRKQQLPTVGRSALDLRDYFLKYNANVNFVAFFNVITFGNICIAFQKFMRNNFNWHYFSKINALKFSLALCTSEKSYQPNFIFCYIS